MKESSYMIAVPKNPDDIKDPEACVKKLATTKGIKVTKVDMREGGEGMHIKLTVNDIPCEFDMFPTDIDIPKGIVSQHFLSDEETEAINKTQTGLAIDMEYTGDPQLFYHIQLKILHALVRKKLAVLDGPSEKILSGKWVKLAARTDIMPAPRYLYTVQAIGGENNEVWLHTHGLRRCGLCDLEILCSSKEMYDYHYRIIESVADRMLERNEQLEMGEPLFLGWLTDQVAMVVTLVPWKEALKHYPDIDLGGMKDREDDVHAADNAVIMLYLTPDDADNKVYTAVDVLDEYLKRNPQFMPTIKERKRMSSLAIERVSYMKKAFEDKDNHILIKMGLEPDEEFRNPKNPEAKEIIWFELLDMNDDTMKLKLTQEPYYVKDLHQDDIVERKIDDIVDWLIYAQDKRLTPDDVYMLLDR